MYTLWFRHNNTYFDLKIYILLFVILMYLEGNPI